jgi:methyltransferase
VPIRLALGALIIFAPMLFEAARAASNERAQRARGGLEPPGDVYAAMRVAYPAAFLAMLIESALRGPASGVVMAAGAVVFGAAKAIKWWAIASLGRNWTFRVITVPRQALVATGPYRLLRHPNYVGVMGELVGAALMAGAPIAGAIGTLGFGCLLRRRIHVEDRALRSALQRRD